MNWTAIGAIGAIVSALAVAASLIYLSRQVAQQSSAATGANMNNWLSDYNSLVLRAFDSNEASEIMRRGWTNFSALEGTDKLRFHAWMITHLLNAQTMYLQQEDKTMHKQITETILQVNASILKLDGSSQWWECAKKTLDPTFVHELDTRIEKALPVSEVFPWFVLAREELANPRNGLPNS